MKTARPTALLLHDAPWTCMRCLRNMPRSTNSHVTYATKAKKPFKRKNRNTGVVLTAASGTVGLGGLAFFADDLKHRYVAVERSGRVLTTLAVCINE